MYSGMHNSGIANFRSYLTRSPNCLLAVVCERLIVPASKRPQREMSFLLLAASISGNISADARPRGFDAARVLSLAEIPWETNRTFEATKY